MSNWNEGSFTANSILIEGNGDKESVGGTIADFGAQKAPPGFVGRGFAQLPSQRVADPGLQLHAIFPIGSQRIIAQVAMQVEIASQFATGMRGPVPAERNALVVALDGKYQRQFVQVSFDGPLADVETDIAQPPDELRAGNPGRSARQLAKKRPLATESGASGGKRQKVTSLSGRHQQGGGNISAWQLAIGGSDQVTDDWLPATVSFATGFVAATRKITDHPHCG